MRKFMVFIITLALAVILLPWLHPRAEAAVIGPDQARVAKFWIGQKYYEVDGKRYNMDVAPYVKNDRTMMPARFLAYSLGIPEDNVKWNEQAQTVNISRGPDSIFMQVGKNDFSVNGYFNLPSNFDVPPEVVPPGRTMIPYRAVAQALGALVFWDDAEQSVTVETWRDVPSPTVSNVKRVDVTNGSTSATVTFSDNTQNIVTTEYPTYITDPRDGGFTLDAINWFKLWGVPDSNILNFSALELHLLPLTGSGLKIMRRVASPDWLKDLARQLLSIEEVDISNELHADLLVKVGSSEHYLTEMITYDKVKRPGPKITSIQLGKAIAPNDIRNCRKTLNKYEALGFLIKHTLENKSITIPFYTLGPAGAKALGLPFQPNWWLDLRLNAVLKHLILNQLFLRAHKYSTV